MLSLAAFATRRSTADNAMDSIILDFMVATRYLDDVLSTRLEPAVQSNPRPDRVGDQDNRYEKHVFCSSMVLHL